MPKASLAAIVKHCDRLLRTNQIKDYDGAVNGLQVENSGNVRRIAATVDYAGQSTFRTRGPGPGLNLYSPLDG